MYFKIFNTSVKMVSCCNLKCSKYVRIVYYIMPWHNVRSMVLKSIKRFTFTCGLRQSTDY